MNYVLNFIHGTDFYRGNVEAIVSSEATFVIQYADGDVDEGMERRCLRPFEPYQVGEKIEVQRKSPGEYEAGIILAIYGTEEVGNYDDEEDEQPSLMFDIQLEETKVVLVSVHQGALRRIGAISIKKGDRIAVSTDAGGEEWFPGQVVRTNPDGTYVIRYVNGNVENNVRKERIRN